MGEQHLGDMAVEQALPEADQPRLPERRQGLALGHLGAVVRLFAQDRASGGDRARRDHHHLPSGLVAGHHEARDRLGVGGGQATAIRGQQAAPDLQHRAPPGRKSLFGEGGHVHAP